MKKIVEIYFPVSNKSVYEIVKDISNAKRESIQIKFSIPKRTDLISKNDILYEMNSQLISRNKDWFEISNENLVCKLKNIKNINNLGHLDWLTGELIIKPEVDLSDKKYNNVTVDIDKQAVMNENKKNKIFLSHKTANKELVREYKKTLSLLGYEPWLDEEDMPAGTIPHRGILSGFQNSCAVVFFITNEFKDERYIANEINYAITEKTERGNEFSIITLVLSDEAVVPDLLKAYIWKSPKSDLEALRDIIKALPFQSK
ncbi:toll/interleukin-1 receptor domain-containing protein [Pontimicrobium sp. MEBiC06410]